MLSNLASNWLKTEKVSNLHRNDNGKRLFDDSEREAIPDLFFAPMYWKVTLMRSGIGLSKKRNDTLVALGLRKRFRTVYKQVNPQMAGLLVRVKELIRVELVDEVKTKEEMKAERKKEKGYVVESVGGTGYVSPANATSDVMRARSSV